MFQAQEVLWLSLWWSKSNQQKLKWLYIFMDPELCDASKGIKGMVLDLNIEIHTHKIYLKMYGSK